MAKKTKPTLDVDVDVDDFIVGDRPGSPETQPQPQEQDTPAATPKPSRTVAPVVAPVEAESLPSDLKSAHDLLQKREHAHDISRPGAERRETLAALNRIRKHWFKIQQSPAAPEINADTKAQIALAGEPDATAVVAEIRAACR